MSASRGRRPGRPRPDPSRCGPGGVNEGVRPADGTLLPIDRIAAGRPFCSGKHKKHGVNVQVAADPFGRLLWASSALPGAVHDVRAACEHGVIDALAGAGIVCWADKGYQGAGGTVRFSYRGRWETLSTGQQGVNQSHAKIRALVEQASPPSSPGGFSASPAARPPASRALFRLSSPCIWPAQAEDGKGSLGAPGSRSSRVSGCVWRQRANFSMAAGVTGVKKLTRLPSGSRNSSDRLPQGIVVGSLTKSVTKPVRFW